MSTIRETVSRIRNIFKAVREDAFLTDRMIYSVTVKYSKLILKRNSNENKLMLMDNMFEYLPHVDLIPVDRIEAECSGLRTGCTIMRTKYPLPKVVMGTVGPLLRAITSIDGGDSFHAVSPSIYVVMTKSTNFKYNKRHYYWYKNGHLYFPDINWEAVSVEGLFEGLIDGFCSDETNCTLMQDRPFPIQDHLFSEIEQMVMQELMTLAKIPVDGTDDSQNILR